MADVPDALDALVEKLRDLDADGFIFRELIREAADRLDVNAAVIAAQHEQIDRLATFIMDEIPGEPSDDGSAVDCAIRLLREWQPDGACHHCDGIGCRACSAAFLAGSATPPEAPQQTALVRLAAASAKDVRVFEEVDGWAGEAWGYLGDPQPVTTKGPTPDAALLALADSVSPPPAETES